MQPPEIENYSFGKITIDGKEYTFDVIITPEGVISNWWRIQGHRLDLHDLRRISGLKLDVLIIGQGASSRMIVPANTRKTLEEKGLEVICLPTKEACERYNAMRENQRAAAALHLTC